MLVAPSLPSFLAALPPGSRVGIVGSRSFPAAAGIESFVAALPPGVVVVSGGARGADSLAAAAAVAAGLQLQVFAAEWARLGRAAGPARNRRLVSSGLSALCVFLSSPSAPSPGSLSALRLARAAGVPVFVFGPAGPVDISF
jgi:predicted Rossmann fold nucleotide-binding protein DprA/Smf involved in DNA uptake